MLLHMWQHAFNIVLSLGLAILVFIPTSVTGINPVFGWTLIIIGVLIAAISVWGLIDEIRYESRQPDREYDKEI